MSSRLRVSIDSRCFIGSPRSPFVLAGDQRAGRLAVGGDRHLVDAVGLLEAHVDPLLARRRQVLAHVVGADRQLAVAAVAEHRELDPGRPAVVEEGVDRRAHRAAGEEDVVDQHDGAAGEVEVEVGGVHLRLRPGPAVADVVAVEGDVDVAERHLGAGLLADQGVQALGEHRAAGVDPDQGKPLGTGVLLGDLVRDADQRAPQLVALEHDLLRSKLAPSWPLWTGLKEPTRQG